MDIGKMPPFVKPACGKLMLDSEIDENIKSYVSDE